MEQRAVRTIITPRSPERLRTDIKTEDTGALFMDYFVRVDDEIEIVHGVIHLEGMRQRTDSDHEFLVRLMSTTPSATARTTYAYPCWLLRVPGLIMNVAPCSVPHLGMIAELCSAIMGKLRSIIWPARSTCPLSYGLLLFLDASMQASIAGCSGAHAVTRSVPPADPAVHLVKCSYCVVDYTSSCHLRSKSRLLCVGSSVPNHSRAASTHHREQEFITEMLPGFDVLSC